MIQYANRGAKAYFALLVCMNGSVVPSALPPAIMSTALSVALALTHSEGEETVPDLLWANQAFAIQIYAIILGFLIVTRTNMALQRYTSAMEGLQVMISKWLDAYMQLCAFVNAHLERDDHSPSQEHLMAWREQMAHWFSLMATFAVAALRGDEVGSQPEFAEGLHAPGDASSGNSAECMRLRTCASGLYPNLMEVPQQGGHKPRNSRTSLPSVNSDDMADSRPPPPSRRGTMAAIASQVRVAAMKDILFGSMSDIGRSDKCQWPHDVDAGEVKHNLSLEYLGSCTAAERNILSQVHDKVLVVSGWICESITRAMLRNRPNAPEGPVLTVPPPVVSRVYQELSNGMQAFHHAMMVVIVPFPFPFAQMLTYLLLGFTFLAPFMVLQFTRSVIFSPILTFIGVFGYNGTDSIAKEIENPFGEDANDLPLLGMHKDFNNSLKELLLPHPHLSHIGGPVKRSSGQPTASTTTPGAPTASAETTADITVAGDGEDDPATPASGPDCRDNVALESMPWHATGPSASASADSAWRQKALMSPQDSPRSTTQECCAFTLSSSNI